MSLKTVPNERTASAYVNTLLGRVLLSRRQAIIGRGRVSFYMQDAMYSELGGCYAFALERFTTAMGAPSSKEGRFNVWQLTEYQSVVLREDAHACFISLIDKEEINEDK